MPQKKINSFRHIEKFSKPGRSIRSSNSLTRLAIKREKEEEEGHRQLQSVIRFTKMQEKDQNWVLLTKIAKSLV